MPFNKKLFAQEFISESLENLDLMHEAVSNLNKNILSHEHVSTGLRELHTIKGTSRLLGFSNIERLSNALENLFKSSFSIPTLSIKQRGSRAKSS